MHTKDEAVAAIAEVDDLKAAWHKARERAVEAVQSAVADGATITAIAAATGWSTQKVSAFARGEVNR